MSFFYTLYVRHVQQSVVFFTEALQRENISETVVVGGRTYTVENGSIITSTTSPQVPTLNVLELAYAKTLARRAPLLSISGTDPVVLDSTVARLQKTQQSLAALQKNKREVEHVLRGLYPTTFLYTLAEVERARNKFLANGTEEEKESYQNAQRQALVAYIQDIQKYRKSFIESVPTSVGRYGTAGYIVDRDSSISATRKLESSIEKMANELQARNLCTSGMWEKCKKDDTALSLLPVPTQIASSEQDLARATDIATLFSRTLSSKSEPAIYTLSDSVCIADIEGAPLFGIYQPPSSGIFSEINPLYVGNVRFTNTKTEKAVPFYNYFFQNNIGYVLDDPLLHYKCVEVGSDLGRLFTLQSVATFAKKEKLSNYTEENKAVFEKIENGTATVRDPISERDIILYINAAILLLKNNDIPKAAKNRIIEVYVQTKNHSASLDSIVNNIVESEESNIELNKKGIQVSLDAAYLFYVRSAFTTLFLSYNPSVIKKTDQFFSKNTLPTNKEPFEYYDSLVMRISPKNLEEDIVFFMQIHNKPNLAPTYSPVE